MIPQLFTLSVFSLLVAQLSKTNAEPSTKDESAPQVFRVHSHAYVRSVSATADEKLLLTAGDRSDGTVRWWRLPAMEEVKKFDFGAGLLSCRVSPDGLWAVSSCKLENEKYPGLTIWDARAWRPMHRFNKEVCNLRAISPDSQLFASSDDDRRVTVRLLESGMVVFRTDALGYGSGACCFSPDGRYLYVASRTTKCVLCLDAMTGKTHWRSSADPGIVTSLQASWDGRFVASGGGRVFDTVTGSLVRTYQKPPSSKSQESLSYSAFDAASQSIICAGGHDGLFRWDLHSNKLIESYTDLGYEIQGMDLLPHSWMLVSRKRGDIVIRKLLPLPKAKPADRQVDERKWLELWQLLAGADATKAIASMHELSLHATTTPALLVKHIRLPPRETHDEISTLIKQLSSDNFQVRKRAATALANLGSVARPALRSAYLSKGASEDFRKMADEVFSRLEGRVPEGEQLQAVRGVQTLGMIGTQEARAVLKELSQRRDNDPVVNEARAALQRLESMKP